MLEVWILNPPQQGAFRSQDYSLPGAKVPGVELSVPGTFAPTNEYTKELILRYTERTFVTHYDGIVGFNVPLDTL